MFELVVYLIIGIVAGFAAGLLGVGGGLIIVPALALLLATASPEFAMHIAVGTSLATIVFTGLSSVYAHHRHDSVQWRTFAWLAPGLLFGSWFGAWLASLLPGTLLSKIFGGFCVLASTQLWRDRHAASQPHRIVRPLLSGAGVVIGSASALVGIGGGSLTVPFLIWRGEVPVKAVATAAAGGVPIALAGAAGFIVAGQNVELPARTLGFVYLPATAGIVATSVLTAPLGARLAQRLPQRKLRRVFAAFLIVLGGWLLLR